MGDITEIPWRTLDAGIPAARSRVDQPRRSRKNANCAKNANSCGPVQLFAFAAWTTAGSFPHAQTATGQSQMTVFPWFMHTVPAAHARNTPPRQSQAGSLWDAQRMSPFEKVRKPWVLAEGQAAFNSAWVWHNPSQQTVPVSGQVVPQSTGFPQDLRLVTVPQRPLQIAVSDLRVHRPLLPALRSCRLLCRRLRRRLRSLASASIARSGRVVPPSVRSAASAPASRRRG